MAKATEKTPPVPGVKTILLSQYAAVLMERSGQDERLRAADFDEKCAILREVAGEPGLDGLWLVVEKGRRKPKWREMRANVKAALLAAGLPNTWELPNAA